jgi:hypothetical protein
VLSPAIVRLACRLNHHLGCASTRKAVPSNDIAPGLKPVVSAPHPRRSLSALTLPAPLRRYGLSALSVGVAVLLMLGFTALAGEADTRPALLVAVVVSSLYGGLGPGLLALALATLVARDPVILLAGALLTVVCARARRHPPSLHPESESRGDEETVPTPVVDRLGSAKLPSEIIRSGGTAPRLEVTTEATWRFHHEQPLDITLPEDEQVEHLYLYSVLAECNDAFARMYGFRAASDVVGTRLVVFLPPSNPKNVAYLRSFIRSGYRLEDAESQEIDRYGHAKYFVNNLVGIFERGQLVGAWGTQRDVTEHRRANEPQEDSSRFHSTKSSSQ